MAASGQNSKKNSSGKSGATKSNTNNKTGAKASGTANNKKTSQGKKNTGTRASSSSKSGKKSKSGAGKENRLIDEIVVLLVLAFSLILLLSNFNLAGSVGAGIKWFMFGLLGVVEYLFPIILTITILFLISNKNIMAVARIKTAAVYVLSVLMAALWQRITNDPVIADTGIGDFFTYSAENKVGGGFFGGLICKALSPLGFWGSIVIIIILAIICIILITEKSFIKGLMNMGESGSRMMHAAKQDYDIYKEHSREHYADDCENAMQRESEEEYLERRRKEKEALYQERQIKRQEQQAKGEDEQARKQAEAERRARARTNKKALGVTSDTELPREGIIQDDIDIHEIVVDIDRQDEYSDDIYEPANGALNGALNGKAAGSGYENAHNAHISDNGENGENTGPSESYDSAWEQACYDAVGKAANSTGFASRNEQDESSISKAADEKPESVTDVKSAGQKEDESRKAAGSDTELSNNGLQADIKPENKPAAKKYVFPPVSLLNKSGGKKNNNLARENQNTAIRLQQTLQNFGVKVTITDISCGPSVTRYELQPEQGVKVSKIVSLADDIKLNLAAADIRIEAPIPGKAAIGIEVPNKEAGSVTFRELVESEAFKGNQSAIAFAAGKDIAGKIIVADIAKMPHLLIAGATGSGKSVCINTIIMSILYRAKPEDVKLIMVDPKVVELSVYNGIPHLLTPVVTDPKKASGALNWAVAEMTDRYKKFAKFNVRDLKGYNAKVEKAEAPEGEQPPEKMPQIVIIIDELADLMMVAPGEVEDAICRLAQLARAAGIHLVIATQRPSVNVITGLIKANVPSRIAFSVSSGVDSRTIIDMNGAEKLLGKGDMLFYPSGYPKPVRVQGAFVSDEEVGKVVDFLKSNMEQEATYNEEITNTVAAEVSQSAQEDEKDAYFADAGRFVIEKEKGSIGMLQRYYKIGFNRAGRIMDQLAEAGVVGPELGTKPRKIEMTLEEFEAYLKQNNIN